jgi:hypothetical protein
MAKRTTAVVPTPACAEALVRLQAVLIAARELEAIQGVDERLLQLAHDKKRSAEEEFRWHVMHHGCLPMMSADG